MKSHFWQRFRDAMSGVSIREIEDLQRSRDDKNHLSPGRARLRFVSNAVVYCWVAAAICAAALALARAL